MFPETSALLVFLTATVLLNISPGPDMLYVISRSLSQGRRAGIVSALGIGVGTLIHTLITALGLSALLLSFPRAYDAIRYAGSAYLVYLGARTIYASRTQTVMPNSPRQAELLGVFRQGIITNVLNPKVALFFLAFLPQFVNATRGDIALQIVLLGTIFDTSGTSWNILVAMLAGRVSDLMKQRSGLSRVQQLLPGLVLIALGILLAVR